MTRSYLTHRIEPLRPSRRADSPTPHSRVPPNCYKQKHIAIVFDVPLHVITRGVRESLVDSTLADGVRVVVRNHRLAAFITNYRASQGRGRKAVQERKQSAREAWDKLLRDMYENSGMSLSEISRATGRDRSVVYRSLQAQGVGMRQYTPEGMARKRWRGGKG